MAPIHHAFWILCCLLSELRETKSSGYLYKREYVQVSTFLFYFTISDLRKITHIFLCMPVRVIGVYFARWSKNFDGKKSCAQILIYI